jgi:hypothetical protein
MLTVDHADALKALVLLKQLFEAVDDYFDGLGGRSTPAI